MTAAPIIVLSADNDFPSPLRAGPEGLLAVGGDLSPQRLLRAYGRGIFPWFADGEPILWWSPDPRFVLFPGQAHVPRSLKRILRQGAFEVTCDRAFAAVVEGCARPRPGAPGEEDAPGTWITAAMRRAYDRLRQLGYAHSLEAWHNSRLVGGLYGVSLGRCFFAESMFHIEANASKVVFFALAGALRKNGFILIDCQFRAPHLAAWGGRSIPRQHYLEWLRRGLAGRTLRGSWEKLLLTAE